MLPCCKGNNNCEVKKVNEVKEAKEGQEDACVYPNNIRFASFRKHKKTNTDMRKPRSITHSILKHCSYSLETLPLASRSIAFSVWKH
jgi:hypothetical protein